MKARVIIGANYGDEGKGTVTATYTKYATGKVLNVLTNGGAQRGHSILTEDGSLTFQHFGSGTCFGADNYYPAFYILNPMQFVDEYDDLFERGVIQKVKLFRDKQCRWSTPYDMMANQILEHKRDKNKHGSCGMGIWETILRYQCTVTMDIDQFCPLDTVDQKKYLKTIRDYFEKRIVESFADNPKIKSIIAGDSQLVHGLQFVDNLCSIIRLHKSNCDTEGFYSILVDVIREV